MLNNWISSKMLSTLAKSMLCISLGVFLVMLAVDTSSAQTRRTVTGTVTDASDGIGIPAVNIVVKGTLIGTSSNIDGTYSLSIPTDAAILVFSSIGYVPQEIQIDGRSTIDVEMSPDVQFLEDVVVVGYGSQDEKEITSSVATITEAEFNQGNVNAPAQLLQGKVPGLSIYNKGGDPNSTPTIRLRGISTVGANTEPLVVIDGVIGASLDNVDPADIESINVLKDGSAAAIYGTRGSSGVILVTTKKGIRSTSATSGENTQIDYSGYLAIDAVQNSVDIMSASEYTAAGGNDLGGNTDWVDLVTRTGVSQVHNISISGGSAKTIYRVSTNIRNANGILEESGFDQINARANINHIALNDKLNLTLNLSATKREQTFSFNEALRYATLYNPTAPVRFDNGNYFQAILFDNFNPVAIIDQNVNEGQGKDINYNVQAEYTVTDNIALNANFGQQFNSFSSGEFYPSTSFFRGLNANGLGRRYFEDRTFTLFEAYGTYRNNFDKIDLSVTTGYSFQEDFNENLLISVDNLPTDALGYYGMDLSGFERATGTSSGVDLQTFGSPDERIIAFFGRANLTFDNAIFFNASLRQEGSTKLGEDNQWGLFPALGLGADILSYVDISALDQLKFRVGYGVTGALPGPSGLSRSQYAYDFNSQTITASNEPNPDLKWEEKAELNLGLDFGLMDERLTGTIDVYTRTINDFILEVDIPADQSTSGALRQYQNVGELKTNGMEFSINYDAIVNQNMQWTTGLVFSTYSTTLEEFTIDEEMRANLGSPGQNSTEMIRVAVGEEIGQIWGPVFDGVDANGAPIMADLNGDGTIDADQGNALTSEDFKQLGSGIPDFELGWTNTVSYQNWDLNAFFRGAFGHSLVNTFRAFYEPIDGGAINSYNRVKSDKAVDGLTVSQFSSLYVEKADFVKLDNVTLGYNFDVNESAAFRKIRAYFSIQNAFTITNYTGVDPDPALQDFGAASNGDRVNSSADVLSPGIDRRNSYFTARTFTFGVQIGF